MVKLGENRDRDNDNELHTETGLEAVSKINAENIDIANYFMTLTTEAAAVNILSESEIINMQSQISDILADLIWQYNGGASTSVTTEIAADLIEGIVFALDSFCISVKSFGNDSCVEKLREKAGIKACHDKGLKYIEQAVNQAKNLYNELYINKLNIGISLYNTAINKSLPLFFKNYNMRFFSHLINPSDPSVRLFCYRLALSSEIKNYKGILYVSEYMRYLSFENEFCSRFDIKDIQRLIKIYADNSGFIVSDLRENIFETVFANVLFSMFAGLDRANLFIKREQYNKIAENFYDNGEPKEEIFLEDLINEYTQKLIADLNIGNCELQSYILKYKIKFTKNILRAIQGNYLHNLITYEI